MHILFAPEGQMPEAPEPFSKKPAKRRIQIQRAAKLFEPGVEYTEFQVNVLLMQLFQDHVFARRMMIVEGILDRTATGSKYWMK
jgi:hypothetical protein